MGEVILSSKAYLAAVIESTPGDFETIDPLLHAIKTTALSHNLDFETEDVDQFDSAIDMGESEIGMIKASLSATFLLKGSTGAGTAPEWGPLTKGVGFLEAIVADTSVTYSLGSGNLPKLSMAIYDDGVVHRCKGMQGSWQCTGNSGKLWTFQVDYQGHFHERVDLAQPTPSFQNVAARSWKNGACQIGGNAIDATSLSFNSNIQVSSWGDPNDEYGLDCVEISKRRVTGSINPKLTKLVTRDYLNNNILPGVKSTIMARVGTTAGNIVQIDASDVKFLGENMSDDNGARRLDLPFQAVGQDGGFTITIT